MALRGYGSRVFRETPGTFAENLRRFGFIELDGEPGSEVVFGIAGQFWRPTGGLRRLASRDAFRDFAEDGCAKGAWNLRIVDEGRGSCELSTETRVQCFGPDARRKFRRYWRLIRPFSGAIRRSLLSQVKRRAERI